MMVAQSLERVVMLGDLERFTEPVHLVPISEGSVLSPHHDRRDDGARPVTRRLDVAVLVHPGCGTHATIAFAMEFPHHEKDAAIERPLDPARHLQNSQVTVAGCPVLRGLDLGAGYIKRIPGEPG